MWILAWAFSPLVYGEKTHLVLVYSFYIEHKTTHRSLKIQACHVVNYSNAATLLLNSLYVSSFKLWNVKWHTNRLVQYCTFIWLKSKWNFRWKKGAWRSAGLGLTWKGKRTNIKLIKIIWFDLVYFCQCFCQTKAIQMSHNQWTNKRNLVPRKLKKKLNSIFSTELGTRIFQNCQCI